MAERVVSVNVGRPTQVPYEGRLITTGIFKVPVDGPLHLGRTNLDGDGQADLKVHGGPDRAAYVYSLDSYDWWARELGHPMHPGDFGENLTLTGFTDADVRIGDRIRIGEALVEPTSPREPCYKLGMRMADKRFVERFSRADRVGFYVRVIEEGAVAAGDPAVLEAAADGQPTIAELHRVYAYARDDVDALRLIVAAPALSGGWRRFLQARLEEAGG